MVCHFHVMHSFKILIYQKKIAFVQKLACEDPVEKLYYSAKFEDMCIHCSGAVDPCSDTEPFYLQCKACDDKGKIPNTKYKKHD